jgi:16S rRNA G966 N2-methylase RsmD
MMQEHPQPHSPIKRASARRQRNTAGQASKPFFFLILNFTLVFVAPPFTKGIQSQAHLYYVSDRKAVNTIKAGR